MEKQFLSVGISKCATDKQKCNDRHIFTVCDQNGSMADEYSYFSTLTNGREFACACCKQYYAEFMGVVNLPNYNSPLMATLCYGCFYSLQEQLDAAQTNMGIDAAEVLFQFGFTFDDKGRKMLSHDVDIHRPMNNGKVFRTKLKRLVGDLM